MTKAIKEGKENGVKEAGKLDELMDDIRRIDRDVIDPRTSAAKQVETLWERAEKMVSDARFYSKESVVQTKKELEKAVEDLTLNTEGLKELAQTFKMMVGENGQGGTYILSEGQKEELINRGASLKDMYHEAMSNNTMQNYKDFSECWNELNDAINRVKHSCIPTNKSELGQLVHELQKLDRYDYEIMPYIVSDPDKSKSLKDTYEKAKDVIRNDSASKEEIKKAENNLRNAVLSLKLNVPKLKELGQKFQEMVGKDGQGGTYYIDKEQTKELTLNLKGIDKKYNQIIKDDNLKNIGEFAEVYRTLEQAIERIENDCPKMSDVNTVTSYGKELNKFKEEFKKAYYHSRFFSSYAWLYNSFDQINEIVNAKKVQQHIESYKVHNVLSIGKELEKITMNIKGLERLNYDVYQYVKDAQKQATAKKDSSINEKAKAVVEALKVAAPILENQNNIRIMNPKGDSFVWNTAGLKKACEAEDKVKKALKELVDEVKKEKLTIVPGSDLQRAWGDLFQD